MQQSAIEDLIDELEEYIDSCKPKFLSSSEIMVNREEIQSLIEELRAKTPEEIARYRKIISNEKAILADAQKKADAIVAKAQIHTEELVSEHQIMQQAFAQANEVVNVASMKAQEMLDRATNESNAIRQSAIEYTDGLLTHVQEILVSAMDSTRRGADTYLNQMQGYLNVVVANRMELSPEPVETAASGPQPQVSMNNNNANAAETNTAAKAAQPAKPSQPAQNATTQAKKTSAATLAPSATPGTAGQKPAEKATEKKEDGSPVSNMSDKFFNKE